MELVISIAFGVWIAFTALVYRKLTSGEKRDKK